MSKIVRLIFEADNKATYSIRCVVDGRINSRLIKRGEKLNSTYTEVQFIENVGYFEKLIKEGNIKIYLNESDTSDVNDILKYIDSISPVIYTHITEGSSYKEPSQTSIERVRHWLVDFPEVLDVYNDALKKYGNGVFHRNVPDDVRLALEKLLHSLFNNQKSLENQINLLGDFIKQRGGSPELANMFVKLVDYYSKYQNSYIKHDDSVIEAEVDFILEISSSFMKHLIKLRE